MHKNFLSENLKGRDHSGMDLWEIGWEGTDCKHMNQDKDL
jgi:hypothetical protein